MWWFYPQTNDNTLFCWNKILFPHLFWHVHLELRVVFDRYVLLSHLKIVLFASEVPKRTKEEAEPRFFLCKFWWEHCNNLYILRVLLHLVSKWSYCKTRAKPVLMLEELLFELSPYFWSCSSSNSEFHHQKWMAKRSLMKMFGNEGKGSGFVKILFLTKLLTKGLFKKSCKSGLSSKPSQKP